jgi:hypothetical protein
MGQNIWVLIPIVAIVGGYILKGMRIKAVMSRSRADDNVVNEIRDSMRRLEDRVTNLERAVTTADTERKYSL